MVVMSIDRDLRFNHCCLVIAMFVAPSICNCKVGVRVCAMCVCAPLTTTCLKFNRTANPYKSKKRSSQGGSVTFVSQLRVKLMNLMMRRGAPMEPIWTAMLPHAHL